MSQSSPTQWYYGSGSEQKGPYTKEQMLALMQAGVVGHATLVWTAGMANWAPAAQSALANEMPAPVAPPMPAAPYQAAPAAAAPNQAQYAPQAAAAAQHAPQAAMAPAGQPRPRVNGFGEAVSSCFKNYVNFSGRANRPEFWYFVLFQILGSILATIVDGAIIAMGGFSPFALLFGLAIFLPALAVSVRRLHDTDRSGWLLLIGLIPFVGSIVLIVLFCQGGTQGRNSYGEA